MSAAFLARLLDEASQPFRAAGRFSYHYARGKLGSDCLFREVLKRGIFPPKAVSSISVADRAACSPGC